MTDSVSVILLTALVFSVAIIPINSLDFFWHLKTGEYIASTGSLPALDPLTYTAVPDDPNYPGRPAMLLKGYWLAQIIFAGIVRNFGLEGMIVFRGLLYAAIALCAICLIRLCSGPRTSLLLLLLLAFATKVAVEDSDRPQIFIFLLSLLNVFICEWALRKERGLLLYLNIPVMLIAANMHPGYIVGVVYLLAYVLASGFEERLKPLRLHLLASSLLALLVTYLNPNHWSVFNALSDFFVKGGAMTANIMEYRSPFVILRYVMSDPGWLAYWVLIVLSVPAVVFLLVKRRYAWCILLAGAAGASLWSMRYIYFFAPLGTFFITLFMQETIFSKVRGIRAAELALIPVFIIFIALRPLHENNLGIKTVLYTMTYPVAAADFMAREKIPQPVFNEMQSGGYLEWRLWPSYRMFIDTRELISGVYGRYINIMGYSEKGRQYLEEYRIASVITPAIDPMSGEIIPLVRGLYEDPGWAVIYLDGQSLIFARKGLYPQELPKYNVYYEVLSEIRYWQPLYPWAKGYEASTSEALTKTGGR